MHRHAGVCQAVEQLAAEAPRPADVPQAGIGRCSRSCGWWQGRPKRDGCARSRDTPEMINDKVPAREGGA
jgi:hypothetical protein